MDLARVVGKLDHGLAGRVSPADNDDDLPSTLLRLDVGRRVVQAETLESICVLGRQSTIVRAGGEDHRSPADALTVGKPDLPQSVGFRLGHLGGLVDTGDHSAELACLERRPSAELRAGEAGGKAEIVLDSSARARLTARGKALDH